jgi:adenylosuccinate synthase
MAKSKIDVLLGLQWGDEGKGKIVDVLSPKYDLIARFQGGPNAGHTLEFEGHKHVLHTIPSGIFHQDTANVIGNGVIIDLQILEKELQKLEEFGAHPEKNLYISSKAHVIAPSHRILDAVYEKSKGDQKIGSTLKGIGPTYTDKVARIGLRMGDLRSDKFQEKYAKLKTHHFKIIEAYDPNWKEIRIDGLAFDDYEKIWLEALESVSRIQLVDSSRFINDALKAGKSVLAEGAQGTLLDIDFGSYPFVTSSNTITAAVCTGLGVSPHTIGKVYGVFKAYCTRVGSGPFPSELFDNNGQQLRDNGHEYGSTTGRPRRCGWLDMVALKYAITINGVTDLVITKADVMDDFETIEVSTHYDIDGEQVDYIPFEMDEEKTKPVYKQLPGWKQNITEEMDANKLPENFLKYIKFVEDDVEVPVSIISVGPDRKQTIIR